MILKKNGNEPIEILFLSRIVEISAAFLISAISVNDFGGWGDKGIVCLRGFFSPFSSLWVEICSIRGN